MKLEVLGSGCMRCRQLAANVEAAVQELGLDAEVVKVEDFETLAAYGIMATPALAIDGQVRFSGRVPSTKELTHLLTLTV